MRIRTRLAIVSAFAALAACGSNNSAANNADMNVDMNAGSTDMNASDMNAVGNSDMNAADNNASNADTNNAM